MNVFDCMLENGVIGSETALGVFNLALTVLHDVRGGANYGKRLGVFLEQGIGGLKARGALALRYGDIRGTVDEVNATETFHRGLCLLSALGRVGEVLLVEHAHAVIS